jgi:hypothetical protein
MTPSPDIHVCLDCGWSEFVIPKAWLSAGWLRSTRPQPVVRESRIEAVAAAVAVM